MKRSLFITTILLFPNLVFAQPTTFAQLVDLLISIIDPLFTLVIALILLMFLYGLARFVFSLGSSDNLEEGKRIMFWGIIALFMVVSFWGIVTILTNTFLSV
ncbi:MAG: hypothetical protein U5L75_00275 [Candidatus Campbellbacteria bacterium]|nr:hypothetical protein [Candidatus Campbellbacteria bacterium]